MKNDSATPLRSSALAPWFESVRWRTLPLATAGTVVAGGLALAYGVFSLPVLVLTVLTAALLQVLSDYANDYGDFEKGTDNERRTGPRRALQRGTMTKDKMRLALMVVGAATFVSGVALIVTAFGPERLWHVLAFLALGILALAAAVKYTMGRGAYGYRALGDLAVFLFFGIASVAGGFFLYDARLPVEVLLPAVALGSLATGVLNLNNMRDIDNDRDCGKTTVVVLMGARRARLYHHALVVAAMGALIAFSALTADSPLNWLYVVSFAALFAHLKRVRLAGNDHGAIDRELKPLSLVTLLVAVGFVVSVNL